MMTRGDHSATKMLSDPSDIDRVELTYAVAVVGQEHRACTDYNNATEQL